jgi:hypothetical protein
MTLQDFLKANEPVVLIWPGDTFIPAYVFALEKQDGIGWVNGDAALMSTAKECHVFSGKVTVEAGSALIEGGDEDDFFAIRLEPGADHPSLVGMREAFLAANPYSREQALSYLQEWFPETAFLP